MIKFMTKLNTSPYNGDIWFTNSESLYLRKRSEIGVVSQPNLGSAGGMTTYFEDGWQQVVGLFNGDRATLVHELSHSVINLFNGVGMPINIDTSEAFCYLIDNLYTQCSNAMNQACQGDKDA